MTAAVIQLPVPPVVRKANRTERRHLARQGVVGAQCTICPNPVGLDELWYTDDRPAHEGCAAARAAAIAEVAEEMAEQEARVVEEAASDRGRLEALGLYAPASLLVAR